MKSLLLIVALLSYNLIRSQNITIEERIYGLSKFWEETSYNFAYFENVPHLDFDSLYKVYLPKVIATENDYEYYQLLKKFCATLKDGHTNIYLPDYLYDSLFYPPIRIRRIEDEVYIINVGKTYKDQIPRGSKITAVNGQPMLDYLNEEVYPYISAPYYIVESKGAQLMLQGLKGTLKTITIETPAKKTKKVKVSLNGITEDWYYPYTKYNNQSIVEFRQLENKIGYLSINSFADTSIITEFKKILPKLYLQKKLIIDIRFNGGGSSDVANTIVKHLTNKPYFFGIQGSTRKHLPSHKAWGAFNDSDYVESLGFKVWPNEYADYYYNDVWEMEPLDTIKNNVTGQKLLIPLVILTSNETASAAEDFLVTLDNVKRGFIIGQKTYGSTGQPLVGTLPKGGSYRICTRKCTYPNGRKFIGIGVQPDIEIEPTLNFYLKNEDVVLEKAIEYLQQH